MKTESSASVPISQQRVVAMVGSKETLAKPIPHSNYDYEVRGDRDR